MVAREVDARDAAEEEPLSLFAPISAVPLGDGRDPEWVLDDDGLPEPSDDMALTIPLPPVPSRGRGRRVIAPDGRTLREHKTELRDANAQKTRLIARHTGMTHAKVNAELNRVSGVKKVSEATVEQLEKRLDKAEQWLRQASARPVAG